MPFFKDIHEFDAFQSALAMRLRIDRQHQPTGILWDQSPKRDLDPKTANDPPMELYGQWFALYYRPFWRSLSMIENQRYQKSNASHLRGELIWGEIDIRQKPRHIAHPNYYMHLELEYHYSGNLEKLNIKLHFEPYRYFSIEKLRDWAATHGELWWVEEFESMRERVRKHVMTRLNAYVGYREEWREKAGVMELLINEVKDIPQAYLFDVVYQRMIWLLENILPLADEGELMALILGI
jgi:hypothetical protein